MGTAFDFAVQLLNSLPGLIQAGIEVSGMIQEFNTKIKDMQQSGRDPTAAEWDELNATIKRLEGDLQSDDH